jgi:hypothetical protein
MPTIAKIREILPIPALTLFSLIVFTLPLTFPIIIQSFHLLSY